MRSAAAALTQHLLQLRKIDDELARKEVGRADQLTDEPTFMF